MKITLGDVEKTYKLLFDISKYEFPLKTAFKIGRLLQILEPEKKQIEKLRQEIIERIGDKNENNEYTIPNSDTERINTFFNEMNDLFATEIKINYTPIPFSEVKDKVKEIKPLDALNLFVFFEDDETQEIEKEEQKEDDSPEKE